MEDQADQIKDLVTLPRKQNQLGEIQHTRYNYCFHGYPVFLLVICVAHKSR